MKWDLSLQNKFASCNHQGSPSRHSCVLLVVDPVDTDWALGQYVVTHVTWAWVNSSFFNICISKWFGFNLICEKLVFLVTVTPNDGYFDNHSYQDSSKDHMKQVKWHDDANSISLVKRLDKQRTNTFRTSIQFYFEMTTNYYQVLN